MHRATLAARAHPSYCLIMRPVDAIIQTEAARRLGVSTGTVLRMIGNVGLDGLISAVPVAGAVGDVFFRANRRNMALLRRHLARPA